MPPTLRLLRILRQHPGTTATKFAAVAWPHLQRGKGRMKPVLLAAQTLRLMKRRGLVRIAYSGNPFKERAWCVYYLSDYGFEICDYFRNI